MGRFPLARWSLSAVTCLFPIAALSYEVGTTAGQFAVSQTGAATYSIPIVIPPGVAGAQPSLSIEYDSGSPNGPLGVGFSLAGFSQISRCPATIAQDGFSDPVDFDNNDRFCLDGRRLVAIDGTGREFRTEIETFTKVVAVGGTVDDPSYFLVTGRTGSIHYYGSVASARADLGGSTKALTWALNLSKDTAGNSVVYQWLEESSNANLDPVAVYYAYGPSGGNGASVILTYDENRADSSNTFVGGLPIREHRLLRTISSEARSYSLSYLFDGAQGQARLQSISECAGLACLPPTTFQWNDPSTYSYQVASGNTHGIGSAKSIPRAHFGDFNGDGRADVYFVHGSDSYAAASIWISQASGPSLHWNGPIHYVSASSDYKRISLDRIQVADINADGLSDVAVINGWGTTEPISIFFNLGNGQFQEVSGPAHFVSDSKNWAPNDLARPRFVDLNGDSLLDLYVVERGTANASLYMNIDGRSFSARIDGPMHQISTGYDDASVSIGRIKHGDFNGDRITDVYVVEGWKGYGNATLHLSTPTPGTFTTVSGPRHYVATTSESVPGGALDLARIRIADFNGDGLSDVIVVNGWNDYGVSTIHLSKGDGTFLTLTGPTFYVGGGMIPGYDELAEAMRDLQRFQFPDINGDGAADVFWANRHPGDPSAIGLSRGNHNGTALAFETRLGPSLSNDDGCDFECFWATSLIAFNTFTRHNWSDVDGDGIADIYTLNVAEDPVPATIHRFNAHADRVSRITNGLGAAVEIDYKPLTDTSVHTKSTGATYPTQDVQFPMYVVSAQRASNGLGGWSQVSHYWRGAKVDLRGRGLLGFESRLVIDNQNGAREETWYRQDYPFIGLPRASEARTATSAMTSAEAITYASMTFGAGSAFRTFPYAADTVHQRYEIPPHSQLVSTATTHMTYDEYGNVVDSNTAVVAGSDVLGQPFVTHVVNAYDNDLTNWRLGRLTRSEVTRQRPAGLGSLPLVATRVSAFEYDFYTGLVSAEIIEPGTPFAVRKDYTRYRGSIRVTQVSGADFATRSTESNFSDFAPYYGRYPTSQTNELGWITYRVFDPATGNVTRVTDPNGLITNLEFDAFGRKTREYFNQHGVYTSTNIDRLWCSQVSICGNGDAFVVKTSSNAGAEAFAVFDSLERETRKVVKNPDGRYVETVTEYDALGRVARKSSPRFTNSAQTFWTTFGYDTIRRVLVQNAPVDRNNASGAITRFEYDGLLTHQWDPLNHHTSRQADAIGLTTTITDALGGTLSRVYDPFDNLLVSTDADGVPTTMAYDIRGRKVSMVDPNMGQWTYHYNALGELTEQKDAKGQIVRMAYDLLGRMIERTELEGTTTWTYDVQRKGSVTEINGPDYRRAYIYKPFGAVFQETISIAAADPPAEEGCLVPLSICGTVPPGDVPEDPVGTVVRLLCAQYPEVCAEPPELPPDTGLPVEEVFELIDELCAERPDVCDPHPPELPSDPVGAALALVCSVESALCAEPPQVPPDLPVDEIVGLIQQLCSSYPEVCDPEVPPPPSDPVGTALNAVCTAAPALCSPPELPVEEIVGLITRLCATYPQACDPQAPEPPSDPIGAALAVVCAAESALCAEPPQVPPELPELDVIRMLEALCNKYPDACGVAPPPPQDPVAEALAQVCAAAPLVCNGVEPPSPPDVEDVVGLIQELCDSYPGICYAQVPPDPTQLPEQLLGYLCASYPQVCNTLPPPDVDPVKVVTGKLCQLNSALCVVVTPPEAGLVDDLQAFLNEFAQDPCGRHTFGSVTIDTQPLCDVLPTPPLQVFASAATPPGTAVFGTRASAGAAEANGALLQFQYQYAYDSLGRQTEITYPSTFRVTNNYGVAGTVVNVKEAGGQDLWTAQDWDEWGNPSMSTFGNGVQTIRSHDAAVGHLYEARSSNVSIQSTNYGWDAVGNLKFRQDWMQSGLRENFTYDALNRLETATLTNIPGVGTAAALTMTYAPNGNILSKSDVGNYVYGAQPHAVTVAGKTGYAYDPNGNMLSGAGRVYTWSSYNLPLTIVNAAGTSEFLYGPERQRIRQFMNGPTTDKLIYYVGALYEEQQYGDEVDKKHYIATPAGIAAIVTWSRSTKREYLHRDHLGSVEVITNGSGQVTERLAYDAFGKRRGVIGQTLQQEFLTARGFTGHEHLDNLDLIHMNGRVYDPWLGRFISADPFVQAPGMSQSHNRYAYVMNNPLSMTDPSGFSWLSKQLRKASRWVHRHREEMRIGIAVIAAAATYGAVSSAVTSSVFNGGLAAAGNVGEVVALGESAAASGMIAGGSAAGFVSGGITSGSVKGAVQGAALGGLAGGIGQFGGGTVARMLGGSINGALQTGSLEGALRGMASGLVPTDLGMTSAFLNNPFSNLGITIGRDALRGYIIDGRDGARRNAVMGLGTNALGHLVGAGLWGWYGGSGPGFSGGAFHYQVGNVPGAAGLTIGNVISYDELDLAMMDHEGRALTIAHEREHVRVQEALGASYLPAHAMSQWIMYGVFRAQPFLELRPFMPAYPYR